jgi:hypothetical protein
LTHIDILELNLLIHEISGPKSDAIVMNGDKFGLRVVEESNLVGSIGANGITTESLSC